MPLSFLGPFFIILGGLWIPFSFKIYKPQYKTDEQINKELMIFIKKIGGKSIKIGSIFMILYGVYLFNLA